MERSSKENTHLKLKLLKLLCDHPFISMLTWVASGKRFCLSFDSDRLNILYFHFFFIFLLIF